MLAIESLQAPMKLVTLSLCIVSILTIQCGCHNTELDSEPQNQATKHTVEKYQYGLPDREKGLRTPYFTVTGDAGKYCLTARDGKVIQADVHYVKTFGGMYSTVSLYVVDKRYLYYPSTVPGSEVKGARSCDMLGQTHIYDLKTKAQIHVTAPYQYDHDVPIRLDLVPVFNSQWLEDLESSGRD